MICRSKYTGSFQNFILTRRMICEIILNNFKRECYENIKKKFSYFYSLFVCCLVLNLSQSLKQKLMRFQYRLKNKSILVGAFLLPF